MACHPTESEPLVCPFIDLNDSRCAKHFSLTRMDEAFEVCLRRHRRCVTYHQILRERDGERQPTVIIGAITLEGCAVAAPTVGGDQPRLRPTGT